MVLGLILVELFLIILSKSIQFYISALIQILNSLRTKTKEKNHRKHILENLSNNFKQKSKSKNKIRNISNREINKNANPDVMKEKNLNQIHKNIKGNCLKDLSKEFYQRYSFFFKLILQYHF